MCRDVIHENGNDLLVVHCIEFSKMWVVKRSIFINEKKKLIEKNKVISFSGWRKGAIFGGG